VASSEPARTDESAGIGYEDARAALVDVVRRMEGGGITLEETLRLWEEGERLAAVCRTWLEGAQARLDAVTEDPPSE
jgi:exodeoxyribonuclease VII small subunit